MSDEYSYLKGKYTRIELALINKCSRVPRSVFFFRKNTCTGIGHYLKTDLKKSEIFWRIFLQLYSC